MSDTPARPVIGVRVHTADGSFLHDLGRDWWRHDDGSVDIEAPVNLLDLDEPPAGHTKRTIAAYLPGVVQRVELALGEPEPVAPTIRDVEREDATPAAVCQVTGDGCDPSYAWTAPKLALHLDEVRLAAKLPIDTKHTDLIEEIESLRAIAENEGAR